MGSGARLPMGLPFVAALSSKLDNTLSKLQWLSSKQCSLGSLTIRNLQRYGVNCGIIRIRRIVIWFEQNGCPSQDYLCKTIDIKDKSKWFKH